MKKKVIIPIIAVVLILVIGVISFILFNNKIASTITLDINPSIEINLNKDEKVITVIALNDDAKEILNNNLKGKTIEETLNTITDNLIKEGYASEEELLEVILYTDGNISNKQFEEKLIKTFREKRIDSDIIIIDKITNDDKKLAKKYNISPAKVLYMKTIIQDNQNINLDTLAGKAVGELKETKETGKYCDKEYTLEGDWCIKEINRVPAQSGKVCPHGYLEYNGNCYEEKPIEETNNLVCRDEFTLQETDCVRKQTVNAKVSKYTCSKGEVRTKAEVGDAPYNSGPANDPVCIDPSKITHPVTPCELPASDPTERMSSGGKCYWHKAPVIEAGCPGKVQVNGFCWDDASGVYLCPNSKNSNQRSKDDNCYVVLNVKATPSEYKCDDPSMRLEGTKCIKEEIEAPQHEKVCPNGYALVNNDRCINSNKTISKESGYICEYQDSKLKGKECIIYERVEAKHD